MQIISNDKLSKVSLGTKGRARPQIQVAKNCWVAASVSSGGYCLVGCTVSPGFDFRDWELGKQSDLLNKFPRYQTTIRKYTTV